VVSYFRTERGYGTLIRYGEKYDPAFLVAVAELDYSAIPAMDRLERGLVVFSDMERMNPYQIKLAGAVFDALSAQKNGIKLLNDPRRALRRYELLRKLSELGLNEFGIYRLDELGESVRYPVYLRLENDHHGAKTPLLESQAEVAEWTMKLVLEGLDARDLVAIEYCDTSDERGMFRKYSAMRVGRHVFPRHLLVGSRWEVKFHGVEFTAGAMAEERRYMEENPHEAEVRELFEIANLEYGRIDYSFLKGKLQTWEINSNPDIMPPPDSYPAERRPIQDQFAADLKRAMFELDGSVEPGPPVPLKLGDDVVRKVLART
jgi:hypothetical protein